MDLAFYETFNYILQISFLTKLNPILRIAIRNKKNCLSSNFDKEISKRLDSIALIKRSKSLLPNQQEARLAQLVEHQTLPPMVINQTRRRAIFLLHVINYTFFRPTILSNQFFCIKDTLKANIL